MSADTPLGVTVTDPVPQRLSYREKDDGTLRQDRPYYLAVTRARDSRVLDAIRASAADIAALYGDAALDQNADEAGIVVFEPSQRFRERILLSNGARFGEGIGILATQGLEEPSYIILTCVPPRSIAKAHLDRIRDMLLRYYTSRFSR